MLTNEPGYVFAVLSQHDKLAGLFYRYETAVEGVRMSIDSVDSNPELDVRKGHDDFIPSVGIWYKNTYVCEIRKVPVMGIAVGMTEIDAVEISEDFADISCGSSFIYQNEKYTKLDQETIKSVSSGKTYYLNPKAQVILASDS